MFALLFVAKRCLNCAEEWKLFILKLRSGIPCATAQCTHTISPNKTKIITMWMSKKKTQENYNENIKAVQGQRG